MPHSLGENAVPRADRASRDMPRRGSGGWLGNRAFPDACLVGADDDTAWFCPGARGKPLALPVCRRVRRELALGADDEEGVHHDVIHFSSGGAPLRSLTSSREGRNGRKTCQRPPRRGRRATGARRTGRRDDGWCQTNSNSSREGQSHCPSCSAEIAPLGKGGGSVQLEEVATGEAAALVEVAEDAGVDGNEFP